MKLFKRKTPSAAVQPQRAQRVTAAVKPRDRSVYHTPGQISSMLNMSPADVRSGRYRTMLYRFLADNIPIVDACIWTWSRLAAAPGEFRIIDSKNERLAKQGRERLQQLSEELYLDSSGRPAGLPGFMVNLFTCLFRDGMFGGFLTVSRDASGVDKFVPVDSADISWNGQEGKSGLVLEHDGGSLALARPDFYHLALNAGVDSPLGRSVLQTVPFVSYIEQQLVDDMRRTSHNSGYHRLHVKIAPPERLAGEAEQAYVDRINSYFDSTVSMIKTCDVDDNPVTWDNVNIEYIGPQHARAVTNNWFVNHRAMVEEICAGTHLAPFLLGYSYGATTTWSAFKFDVVMRQVRSVQAEAAQLLEWIGNVDLALSGLDMRCRFVFDNSFAYQATDESNMRAREVDSVLKLYQAGLLDEETARDKAGRLV